MNYPQLNMRVHCVSVEEAFSGHEMDAQSYVLRDFSLTLQEPRRALDVHDWIPCPFDRMSKGFHPTIQEVV